MNALARLLPDRWGTGAPERTARAGWEPFIGTMRAAALFVLLCEGFFLVLGRNPIALLAVVCDAAVGSGYALTESIVRATPILLCALATAIPARMGLISVGAEGQLVFGALTGTGFVLAAAHAPAFVLMPGMLLAGAFGGAAWAVLPALLRTWWGVSETIATLLLNYVAALLVTWLVFGPWKDPASQGWPATISFPEAAKLPAYFDSRVHLGLWLALGAVIGVQWLFSRTRFGLVLEVLRSGPRPALIAGLDMSRYVIVTMVLGGALAGLAGISEVSAIQGRLQQNLSGGAGLSGFLVAWAGSGRPVPMLVLALLVGGLLAAGDGIQMNANVPSSITLVIQGLLFVAILAGRRFAPGSRP